MREEETGPEELETPVTEAEVPEEEPAVTGPLMVITEGNSNIRSGPGTSHDVLRVADEGETFIATGNEDVKSSGSVWYEVYLNEEGTETGWASQKVIRFVEEGETFDSEEESQ